MKKLVVAASLLAALGAAHADLSLVGGVGSAIVGFGTGNLGGVVPQDYGMKEASIVNSAGGPLRFTYLGTEAAAFNQFSFQGMVLFDNMMNPPKVKDVMANAGPLVFTFLDGGNNQITASYAVLGKQVDGKFVPYKGAGTPPEFDYVLGFNDSGSKDGDFDDLVFGVTAIPEPSTYALMAAGLGAVGFVARRRRRRA